jgi:uncharacterized protein YndB with AHSA1/START domain
MSAYGEATGKDTLRMERLLPGPIERVWAYLTESEKRSKWLASGEMELRVGGRVSLRFTNATLSSHPEPTPDRYKHTDCGAGFEGTITACEPPRLLAYTWSGDTSEVKFELTPQASKVLLVITHSRLPDRGEMACVASGWHAHTGILEDILLEQPTRPFWSEFTRLEVEYDRRLPR